MNSPVTGKEMKKEVRKQKMTYKKENFEIYYVFYKCKDSGEEFTDDELDTFNMNQVFKKYKAKHGIKDDEKNMD